MSELVQRETVPGKIEESFLDNRIIFVMEEFTDSLAKTIVSKLLYLDSLNNDPITIYICSPGGEVASLFSIIDTMSIIESEVNTVGIGECASAAGILLMCGKKRRMLKHASVMIHQLSSMMFGKFEGLDDEYSRLKKIQNELYTIIESRTKLTIKVLQSYGQRDIWFTSDEALKHGIVDEIITKLKRQ